MPDTYSQRKKLVDIARLDRNKVEVTKNQAPWIKKLWPATNYGLDGYKNREPYCATGVCYCIREWLKDEQVRKAFKFTEEQAEKFRPKTASVFKDKNDNLIKWAKENNLDILTKKCILHMGDIVIYTYSHAELITDDDNTETGPFVAIGFNTNAEAERDGEGCFEKPRTRSSVKCIIRMLP